MQKRMVVVGVLLLVAFAFGLNQLGRVSSPPLSENHYENVTQETDGTSYIYVDIRGAVNKPGVYKVPDALRVFQLVDLAGGLLGDADLSALNLSKQLHDQAFVFIPFEEMEKNKEELINDSPGLIALSSATKEELITLPNIGPATADSIIRYREEHGPFTSYEDILNVTGIGEATLENIRPFVVP